MFSLGHMRFALVVLLLAVPACFILGQAAKPQTSTQSSGIPANQMPFAQEDRQIDFLGANIDSPAAAEIYVQTMMKRMYGDAAAGSAMPAVHRLALAEYASLSDPTKRIPEARIVDAFNRMMDDWGEPSWTRITPEDFHRFHKIKAATSIPYSASRNTDGTIADTCRPAEAFYLLEVLSIDRSSQYNYKTLPDLPDNSVKGPIVASGTYGWQPAPQTAEFKAMLAHDHEYIKNYDAWLLSRFDSNRIKEIKYLLDALHID